MSKICPINNSIVLYLDCLECDDKICKKQHKVDRMSNGESTKVSKTKDKYKKVGKTKCR